ncbi:redoxin domain-containing protein [Glycomyces harbinensis]|uniref:Thiol-disulfide isomerase or thioredoxin n=1 Tax=Glycomyces harbinensis TaxID=58114 RepID=A0A1G6XPL8_9ACTN|nr:redoxin domain-containing protein [Glycomyces harbinensis]SDD80090.1 Thiol-disulfide isomerase or thioredoxin [Glycomyces harbinensis]
MKRTVIGAVAVAAVLTLGACSAGAPDGAVDETTSSGETTTAPNEPTAETEPDAAVPELLGFTATDIDGDAFEGASLAGSPAVLWFWQEDCPICQSQGPDVAALIADHGDRVAVVGIAGTGLYRTSTDEQRQAFVEDTGTGDATHLQSPDGELWTRFGVTSQSTYVLLDSSGEIVDSGSFSGGELDEKVAELS